MGTARISAINVTLNVPTRRARAPKLGALPDPGAGIQRVLVRKCTQSSLGTKGAASLKMNTKIARIPMMLLHPQIRIIHSIGFSTLSRRPPRCRKTFRDARLLGTGATVTLAVTNRLVGGCSRPVLD